MASRIGIIMITTEADKIYPTIKKYLDGKTVIDIGCGPKTIVHDAIGIDMVEGAAKIVINQGDIYNLHLANKIPPADVVFSSHCLEHLCDVPRAISSWISMIKPGGYLILYLPDERYYNNQENIFHVQSWTYEGFLKMVEYFKVVESGLVINPGYSFYVVLQERAE